MSQLFKSLGNQRLPQSQNPLEAVQQLRNDPVGFLKSRGVNIPSGVNTSNPQAIINSLVQSGQIPNGRYQQAMQMLRKMGFK